MRSADLSLEAKPLKAGTTCLWSMQARPVGWLKTTTTAPKRDGRNRLLGFVFSWACSATDPMARSLHQIERMARKADINGSTRRVIYDPQGQPTRRRAATGCTSSERVRQRTR